VSVQALGTPCLIPVHLVGPAGPSRGFITRLGRETLAISTDPELPIGCPVDLKFQRPGDSEAIECSGEVRRLIPDVGLWRGRPAALVELTTAFPEDLFGAQELRGTSNNQFRRGSEAGAPVPTKAGMSGSLRGGLGRRRRASGEVASGEVASPNFSQSGDMSLPNGTWGQPDVSEDDITAPPVRPGSEDEVFAGSDHSDGLLTSTAGGLLPVDETGDNTVDDSIDQSADAFAPAAADSSDGFFGGGNELVSAEVGVPADVAAAALDLFGGSDEAAPPPKTDSDFLALFGTVEGSSSFHLPEGDEHPGDQFGAGLGDAAADGFGAGLGEPGGDLSAPDELAATQLDDPPMLDDSALDGFFEPGGIDDDAPPKRGDEPETDDDGYFQIGGGEFAATPAVSSEPPPVQEALLATGEVPPARDAAVQSASQWRPEPPASGRGNRAPWEDADSSGASLIPVNARIESNLPVTFWARGRSNDAMAQNFSKEGLFLVTDEPPPVRGAIVRVEFPIEGSHDSVPIRFNAEVRWHKGDPGTDGTVEGFGIQILTFETPKDRKRYDELLLQIIRLHRTESKAEGVFG